MGHPERFSLPVDAKGDAPTDGRTTNVHGPLNSTPDSTILFLGVSIAEESCRSPQQTCREAEVGASNCWKPHMAVGVEVPHGAREYRVPRYCQSQSELGADLAKHSRCTESTDDEGCIEDSIADVGHCDGAWAAASCAQGLVIPGHWDAQK